MPPKVYVTAYPAGDFRAMPALGGGHALLKWVTSFPGNPAKGLPTVMGVVLVSSAEDGRLVAVLDAGAVTAVRTGAAAVLAAEMLGRADAETAAVVGAGVNGEAAARTFAARGHAPLVWDVDAARAAAVAERVGGSVAASREEALAADLLVTVTPGREVLLPEGSLQPGQHVSLMGADGPGKAEIAVAEIARCSVFCDDWEQAIPRRRARRRSRSRSDPPRRRRADRRRADRCRRRAALTRRHHDLRLDRARVAGSGGRTRRARGRGRARLADDRALMPLQPSRGDRAASRCRCPGLCDPAA